MLSKLQESLRKTRPSARVALALAKQVQVELLSATSVILALLVDSKWVCVLPVILILATRLWSLYGFVLQFAGVVDRIEKDFAFGSPRGVSAPKSQTSPLAETPDGRLLEDPSASEQVVRSRAASRGQRLPCSSSEPLGAGGPSIDQIIAVTQALMPSIVTPMLYKVESLTREQPELFQMHGFPIQPKMLQLEELVD